MNNKWHLFYIDAAELYSTKSKDRSTGVGAVIVGPNHEIRSAGYNGFPRNVNDNIECRHDRPAKYEFTEHAERNAIYNAARMGTPIDGCTMYLNWLPLPCPDCARAVIQSGIKEVVGPLRPFVSHTRSTAENMPNGEAKDWQKSFNATEQMFSEAGIIVTIVPWRNENAQISICRTTDRSS
jgi:dCMP deaminase